MRCDFSAEQKMLAQSVRRALESLETTRLQPGETADQIRPTAAQAKDRLVDLGVFGLLVPEDQGGLGLGMVEAVAVAMETGRAALPFPAIESIVATAVAARTRADILSDVLDGSAYVTAPVHGELSISDAPNTVVAGTVNLPFASEAKYMLASLKNGHDRDRSVLIELNGQRGEATDAIDLTYGSSRLEIAQTISGNEIVDMRSDAMLGILAAAEIVGAAEHCLDRTVAYLKERKQFGKVIGTFQGLKHIAADCCMQLEAMKASVEYAAALFDRSAARPDDARAASEAETAYHMAKAYCSEAGLKIAEQCIQMHGGIAFTWEYGLHLHFRRITRLAGSHGTAYAHRESLAARALAGAAVAGGLAADPELG
ncbi:MAG: acyl-CoA dehydrogenase family protein [Rhizobiaceae bacterium]